MLNLDFTIITTEERAAFVKDFFSANPDYKPGKYELTTITNYILYGKDPYIDKKGNYVDDLPVEKWTNMSSRKEIEIPTKYSTWNKKQPLSLEETLESPTFNEVELLRPPIHTKTPRPVFDRSLESDIPTIKELWANIDYYSNKIKDTSITNAQKYQYTHMLIELRRQQFTMRDMFKPMRASANGANRSTYIIEEIDLEIDWDREDGTFGCAPMGLYHKGDLRFENPLALTNERDYWGYNKNARVIIDFTNPEHIDNLVFFYRDLAQASEKNSFSSQKTIVETLDYYINNTKLSECQRAILQYKIDHYQNKDIAELINKKFNKTHSTNYISTIYQKICTHVAETAVRIFTYYSERINPFAFKKCAVCGQLKLRNSSEFMRKTRNSDGFSSKCKECEHKK